MRDGVAAGFHGEIFRQREEGGSRLAGPESGGIGRLPSGEAGAALKAISSSEDRSGPSPRYSRYPMNSMRSPELRRGLIPGPTVGRFALAGRSPRLTDAIVLAERVHAALVELSDGSATFTGCDGEGRPLSGHNHAFILPESVEALGRGREGEVTSVTVYAPAGFGSRETAALEALREVRGDGIAADLTLLALGFPGDFGGTDAARGGSPLLAESKTWTSRTPFIPTRHPKATRAGAAKLDPSGRQIAGPEHELLRLLALAGFPEPAAVEAVSFTDIAGERVGWSSFRRARNRGDGRRAGSAGYGFRIEFAESVRGPVAVGYGAYFGMGGLRMEIDYRAGNYYGC
ncbi:type I-U CRISPR-associated protein Csb2 [Methanotrichaceae archaeon M04Ac]|jgi:CRISPR-associated protein Csb2|uniref:Type I-U CRISPR-associated protein Csb2 n=1 Tax=Candidatus Methanocrinis alkalitolerans TaxID=3033395 RepID=A0ABT5XHH7_9EURY|nr:type I-U CRISPR-associated protein Csb2 [Candidatus Methanocrinis alkalitolerans]MDF0594115.1 type I-U CRISPR-associated protein Csb2 [Candidatus Methanocrinis alkalitolerans]